MRVRQALQVQRVKIVVGRNEADNAKQNLVQPGDTLVEPSGFLGPAAIVAGEEGDAIAFAGGLIVRYALDKAGEDPVVTASRNGEARDMRPASVSDVMVEEARIC